MSETPTPSTPLTHRSVVKTTRVASLRTLRPHPQNPNNGDVDVIAESLQANGQYRPIVARVDGTILAGHHVYAAALQLGWSSLLVTFVDVDDETALRILLADNRIADLGPGVDAGLLVPLLAELADTTDSLIGTGFTPDDLKDLEAELEALNNASARPGVNDAPEPRDHDTISVTGDVWLLGRHRLVVGDARDDVVLTAADRRRPVGLLLVDPPADNLDGPGVGEMLGPVLVNACEHMEAGASFYVFTRSGGGLCATYRALAEAGLSPQQTVVWVKSQIVFDRANYHERHESIVYGWKPGATHVWGGGRKQDTVLEHATVKDADLHPTMKPVDLLARLVTNSTERGAVVLDPFAGSGSVLIACETTGRTAVAVEIDPRYADVIARRFQAFTGIVPVRESTGEQVDFVNEVSN